MNVEFEDQELTVLQDFLTTHLFRLDCPPAQELGNYHLRHLTADRRKAIKEHLDTCPHCAEEISQLESYLQKLAPYRELPERRVLKDIVAELVSGAAGRTFGGMAPAFGLRGGSSAIHTYQAGGLQVKVEIQADLEQPELKALHGLILGAPAAGFQARLWQAGEYVTTADVQDDDSFTITGLTPATYELMLISPEENIHIPEIEVV